MDLVELGHAERRHYFNETDESVRRKVRTALSYGLWPLVCIGESRRDRDSGLEKETITRQLRIAFSDLLAECASMLMLAYEPVWAIGEEGTTASTEEVRLMNIRVRRVLEEMFGEQASSVPVLYGGTVDEANCRELLLESRPDGSFVRARRLKCRRLCTSDRRLHRRHPQPAFGRSA